MNRKTVFFDLDGTLTDSGEGIINCAQLALRHFGINADNREPLRRFIGPPLRESFPKFGVPEERVEEAVTVFRSRYLTVGKFENTPYTGIRYVLETLKAAGADLYVATSKPEETAVEILNKFDLARYFTRICGATMDGTRDSKESVLAYLLALLGEGHAPVMVGDTIFDAEGARQFGIPFVGVDWGYGVTEEMYDAGAVTVVSDMEGLLKALENL